MIPFTHFYSLTVIYIKLAEMEDDVDVIVYLRISYKLMKLPSHVRTRTVYHESNPKTFSE